MTKPWVVEAGIEVLNQPFSSPGSRAMKRPRAAALRRPSGEKEEYVTRAMRNITPYLQQPIAIG
jgi:hypothetical protein